jgi:DNA-directed RNA polymerase specialized sigma24 family protein
MTMKTIETKQDQAIETKDVTLPAASTAGSNDNAKRGGVADTTAMLAHRRVVDAITATLVKRGRRARHLEDAVPEVQMRCLEAARRGPMPRDVDEWCALAITVAQRYAERQGLRERARARYDTGLCEEPDAYGPIEKEGGRDPVDTKRYLAVLKDRFDAGRMPEMGGEILWGAAEDVPQREIAEETGLTQRQVKHRLRMMRRVFAARIAELGMTAMPLLVACLVASGCAANDADEAHPGALIDAKACPESGGLSLPSMRGAA